MKLIAALLGIVFVVAFVVGLSFLLAYPTMWLVNYVFASSFLTFLFGTPTIGVLKAWALNAVAGFLFKSSTSSSK